MEDPIQPTKKEVEGVEDKCQLHHQEGQVEVEVVPNHLEVVEGLVGEAPYWLRVVVQEEWEETVLEVALEVLVAWEAYPLELLGYLRASAKCRATA